MNSSTTLIVFRDASYIPALITITQDTSPNILLMWHREWIHRVGKDINEKNTNKIEAAEDTAQGCCTEFVRDKNKPSRKKARPFCSD